MLGNTHLTMGIATSLLLVPPKSLPELVVGIGAGALGGLICDIDVGTSKSHKQADIITMLAAVIVAGVILIDWIFKVGIQDKLMSNANFVQVFIPTILFIAICAIGKNTKHRTFMHSLVAGVLLTACMAVALPTAAPYFAIGFASHVGLDTLNKKKVKIFFPADYGVRFNLCSSNGKVNHILFYVGIAVSVICSVFAVWNMYNIGQYIHIGT